ncbi:hypothetical protein MYX64_07300 [Nitrospinae bacterium AH_259_B05_G02_I21]|nr:hypothetical protein [Nitrospinae bacterium AH_259_B05_G02_I21]
MEMLELLRGVLISPRGTLDGDILDKTGGEVYDELGGRYLLRYLLPRQVGMFNRGSSLRHYTTPTPYAPEDTITYLNLPTPREGREYVMALDPSKIPTIKGPRWVEGGIGIEYLLPNGFPDTSVVWSWEKKVT